uniref:hypothetical protein n=1 Tax=Flavobacterium sp. TaxID=239 RepID=UPI00404A01A1
MPILDRFGIEIEYYPNFPNDIHVLNIEFGAGKNNFGKREFPKCYLTDLSYPDDFISHFKEFGDYENENCHFLDASCDFYSFEFERTFENIILCNPYKFGYHGLGAAKAFFDRAGEILSENGKIHVIGKSNNPWCKKDGFVKFLKNEIVPFKSKYNYELESFESLDDNHSINTQYVFFECGLEKQTRPNEKLIIKKV